MKHNFKYIVSIVTAIILLSNAYAQNIEVKVNKDSMLIGEQISLSIKYPISNGTSSLVFEEGDSIGNGFEIFEVQSRDTVNGIVNIQLGISTFEFGNQFIPKFSVAYDQNIITSDSILVFVSLVAVDTSKPFKDISPIFDDPLTTTEKWKLFWNKLLGIWYILLIIILLIIVLIWFLFFRKKKEKAELKEVKKIIPAHILANRKLDILESKKLWQNGNQKEYNVQLTEIIQEYLSDRYKVPTKERTSSEILNSIRFVEMDEQNTSNLGELLMLSDLVKFAKEQPTPEENNRLLDNARKFVKTTKNRSIK